MAGRASTRAPQARLEAVADGSWRLSGPLRLESAATVLALGAAAFAGRPSVEVDLEGVVDADSAGLAVLIEWTRLARREGRAIRFRALPSRLADLARLGGVAELLPVGG